MLTKRASAVSLAVLAGGSLVAVTSGTAYAGPCTSSGKSATCSYTDQGYFPGSRDTGDPGGSGGPGLGCPNLGNTIACPTGNAPQAAAWTPPGQWADGARMGLIVPAPHVHTAPAGRTYVQIKTGLWVDKETDWVTPSFTLPGPGYQITATATPKSVTWQMGDGSVTCDGPGVAGGTRCSYTYRQSSAGQPGRKYQIRATIMWAVHWTCTGDCRGDDGGDLAALTNGTAAQLGVGEVQTESRPG